MTAPDLSFDRIAEIYDRARDGYPTELFDDIIAFTGTSTLKRALEIGCATGQATLPFAARGVLLICLEPGENLARLARRNLENFKNVEVVCASFEDWNGEPQSLDLVFSANAYHWVERGVRTRKSAELLRPGGSLAIFRSFAVQTTPVVENAVGRALGGVPPVDQEPKRWPREAEIRKSGYFENLQRLRYESSVEYDGRAYVELLSTWYRYHHIPVEDRPVRFGKVRETIGRNGGKLTVRYVTQLLLARRKTQLSLWQRLCGGFSSGGLGITGPRRVR